MTKTTKNVAELTSGQRVLLEQLLKKKRAAAGLGTPGIPRRETDGKTPLSFAQQRLWFLDQLEPGSNAYNISTAARISGRLDVPALEKALQEILRRHESLRTVFPSQDGEPYQFVRPSFSPDLVIHDLSGLPDGEREREARRLVNVEAQRPFDLIQGPLIRTSLFRLDESDRVLFFAVHHIAFDGWSMGVFFRELWSLYSAFVAGRSSPLPELPIQYADFAFWQRRLTEGEEWKAQLAYWDERLRGAPPVLQLPTDRRRAAIQSHRGGRRSFLLPETLSQGLKQLSTNEGVTLFVTLLSAYKTLLYRLSKQDDIVVGSPIAGRNREELEGLIGFFVNTLALRSHLSGDMRFTDLLAKVRETALGAYSHQDVPFEKLVEELHPTRSLSYSPVFQVMFVLQNTPWQDVTLPSLSIRPFPLESTASKIDLTLHMAETDRRLSGALWYNRDLFDGSTIARIQAHLQTLLQAVVDNPGQRLQDLPLMSESERTRILVQWNDTRHPYPRDKRIHQLIEEQVERTPGATALVYEGRSVRYTEMNARANRIAHSLVKRGAGPGKLVGICMERSIEMIAGLLGILKTGAAYVPLDPSFPRARLSFMLEDARIDLLVTANSLLESLPRHNGDILCLDRDSKQLEAEPEANPDVAVEPDGPAYVIYTSGSTGRPKGVLTSHRNVVQHLDFVAREYELTSGDVVLQIPSFSFDASVRDIFGPLAVGAKIIVMSHDEAKDPEAMLTHIVEKRVTCLLSLIPSLLAELLAAAARMPSPISSLRLVLTAGEVLSSELAKRARETFGCEVVNQYGPTECTLISTRCRSSDSDPSRESVLIGKPISNTRCYILDEVLNPVPIGVHGELHIGGHGVTAGYLNRPDLTREKFILDVFGEEPDSRLYKTGDIARYLPDGNIEFLGRRDGQIKLRGFRIELGEIESAVSQHPQISENTVVLTEEGNGNKGLVAYVAARSSALLSTSDLRRFLEKRLPDYMIPSRFVLLEALPRTANRKVDHAALPSLGNERPILHSEFTPPRTRLERIAAEVWADTLGIDRVGVHDNFFELGGHSLLATRLIARLRETFGVDLPLKSIFTEPTVATFAKSLEYQEGLRSYVYCPSTLPLSSIVPIQTAGSRIPLFLVAGAHGDEDRFMRYLSNLIPHLGVDQPVYGLKPRGLDGKEKSQSSVEEMATDYLKEVRDLWPNGPYILVGECVGGIVAYEMAQRLLAEGRKDVLLILMDTHMPSRRRAAYSRLMYISRRLHSRIKDLRELLQRGFRGGGGHLLDILRRKRRVLLPLNPEERTFARIRTVELSYRKTIYRYRPEPYPGKLVLLVNEVRHARSPMLGWEKVNLGGIEVHAVPGDHLTRLTVHGRTLAQQVRACLDTAQLDPFEAESKPQQSGRGNPSN